MRRRPTEALPTRRKQPSRANYTTVFMNVFNGRRQTKLDSPFIAMYNNQ
jgi:hypothetical protein